MSIRVHLRRVSIPLHEPFRISSGSVNRKDGVIVEIRRNGCAGFGEASPMSGFFYSSETPESSWAELRDRLVPAFVSSEFATARRPAGELATQLEQVSSDPFARAGLGAFLRTAPWESSNSNLDTA